MRGRYPSEVRIIPKPRQSRFSTEESDRDMFWVKYRREEEKKNTARSYIDCNLRCYRISIGRGQRGGYM